MAIMAKTKKNINNQWLLDGLEETGLSQAQLSRETGIESDRLNKSLKNRREVPSGEYRAIEAVFKAHRKRDVSAKESDAAGQLRNDTPQPSGDNRPVGRERLRQEVGPMPRDILRDSVLSDLVGRMNRIEAKLDRLLDGEPRDESGPTKRQKAKA